MKSFLHSNFWIKFRNWEYWPWYVVYMPIFAYWLWCGLKSRAIFYLSAANPGFEYGGIIGASKNDILNKLPQELVPTGILIASSTSLSTIIEKLKEAGLSFPVIVKPDIGERGYNVELVKNEQALQDYLSNSHGQLIVQEYINLPMEAGVFYYRLPDAEKGTVTSIVLKGLLTVIGDGKLSIKELMHKSDRAKLQINRLADSGTIDLATIPGKNEEVLLEPIGNHNRGTAFLDGNHLINQQLIDRIDCISSSVDGFYYGRYDLRCKDEQALYRGEFKIMELNGAASEPAHIYAPGFPLLEGYRVLFKHWRILYKISMINHKKGVPFMSFRTGMAAFRKSRFTKHQSRENPK